MPCRDYEPDSAVDDMRVRLNKVTALLCGTLHVVEDSNYNQLLRTLYKDVPELREWWKHHKEMDRKREEQEKKDADRERLRKLRMLRKLARELGVKVSRTEEENDTYYDPIEGDRITADYNGDRLKGVVLARVPMKGIYPYDVGWQVRFDDYKNDVRITRDANIKKRRAK